MQRAGFDRESFIVRAGVLLQESFPEVLAAYLFGSRAGGRARLDSDVDIALLVDAPETPGVDAAKLRLRAAIELEGLTGGLHPDVVVLGRLAPPVLAFSALQGMRIFDRDPDRRIELEAELRSRYYDTRAMRQVQRGYLTSWFSRMAQEVGRGH